MGGGVGKRRSKWANMTDESWGAMKEAVNKFGSLPDTKVKIDDFGEKIFKVMEDCENWSTYVVSKAVTTLKIEFYSANVTSEGKEEVIWSVHWQDKGPLIRQKIITPDGVTCRTYADFMRWVRHAQQQVAARE